MNTIFTITEVTNEKNGYLMPIVKVKSSTNLEVINRGYNEFECMQDIDESDLLKLRELFPGENKVHLEITTPARKTCAWYCLVSDNICKKDKDINNIQW